MYLKKFRITPWMLFCLAILLGTTSCSSEPTVESDISTEVEIISETSPLWGEVEDSSEEVSESEGIGSTGESF